MTTTPEISEEDVDYYELYDGSWDNEEDLDSSHSLGSNGMWTSNSSASRS